MEVVSFNARWAWITLSYCTLADSFDKWNRTICLYSLSAFLWTIYSLIPKVFTQSTGVEIGSFDRNVTTKSVILVEHTAVRTVAAGEADLVAVVMIRIRSAFRVHWKGATFRVMFIGVVLVVKIIGLCCPTFGNTRPFIVGPIGGVIVVLEDTVVSAVMR